MTTSRSSQHPARPPRRRLAARLPQAWLGVAALGFAAACGNAGGGGNPSMNSSTAAAQAVGEALTTPVIADLTHLREEEKLARDVYLTLAGDWAIPIFSNISGAEQQHMDRVGGLLARYQLADPVVDDTVGAFTSAEFQSLHTQLVTRGTQSEVDALNVGATIEELDIADIEAMQARDVPSDVAQVYDSLKCGSRNHLRAFVSQLSARGETFVPQHISQQDTDAILSGEQEMCGGA